MSILKIESFPFSAAHTIIGVVLQVLLGNHDKKVLLSQGIKFRVGEKGYSGTI